MNSETLKHADTLNTLFREWWNTRHNMTEEQALEHTEKTRKAFEVFVESIFPSLNAPAHVAHYRNPIRYYGPSPRGVIRKTENGFMFDGVQPCSMFDFETKFKALGWEIAKACGTL